MNSQTYSWLHYSDADIKVEAPSDFSLLSPPTSPFSSPSITNPTLPSSLCRRRSTSLASPRQRPHPYLQSNRSRVEDLEKMSWRVNNVRRSSEGESNFSASFTPIQYAQQSEPRPSTSSLTGAIGDPATRHSSPQPSIIYSSSSMTAGMGQQPIQWTQTQATPTFPGVPGLHFEPVTDISGYEPTLTPPSDNNMTDTMYTNHSEASYTSSPMSPQEVIRRLQLKVRQLEQTQALDQERIRMLDAELRRSGTASTPVSPSFQASWKARTDARVKQFCSLNRAGNALCSWHDSRRERRTYPPRMAPTGYLNCGCTFEEALFEESLSRHGVGSYLPGETVRMDPALRNPLLKLLQQRYGYRDGDFERNPRTGDWTQGEGHVYWEQQIQAGIINPRRPRHEHDRR